MSSNENETSRAVFSTLEVKYHIHIQYAGALQYSNLKFVHFRVIPVYHDTNILKRRRS